MHVNVAVVNGVLWLGLTLDLLVSFILLLQSLDIVLNLSDFVFVLICLVVKDLVMSVDSDLAVDQGIDTLGDLSVVGVVELGELSHDAVDRDASALGLPWWPRAKGLSSLRHLLLWLSLGLLAPCSLLHWGLLLAKALWWVLLNLLHGLVHDH